MDYPPWQQSHQWCVLTISFLYVDHFLPSLYSHQGTIGGNKKPKDTVYDTRLFHAIIKLDEKKFDIMKNMFYSR